MTSARFSAPGPAIPAPAPAAPVLPLSVRAASVAENLALFHGVWLDLVAGFHPDGTPMTVDTSAPSAPALLESRGAGAAEERPQRSEDAPQAPPRAATPDDRARGAGAAEERPQRSEDAPQAPPRAATSDDDTAGEHPWGLPYQQLVYLDFDGERLTQTNVVVAGRAPHVRTFRARVVDGVLRFDPTGLEAPSTIGVSGGPGVLIFLPERVDTDSHRRFADPDYIRHLGGDQRTRTTTLYRDGELKRVLTVSGTRVADDPSRRLPWDPRGPVGPVHEATD